MDVPLIALRFVPMRLLHKALPTIPATRILMAAILSLTILATLAPVMIRVTTTIPTETMGVAAMIHGMPILRFRKKAVHRMRRILHRALPG
jgi:hypothetical protein